MTATAITPPIAWLDGPLWPYLALVLFAVLPTEIWRWLAVAFSRRIDADSPALERATAAARGRRRPRPSARSAPSPRFR